MKITRSNKIGRAIMLVALLLLTTHLQAQTVTISINGTEITVDENDVQTLDVPFYSLLTVTATSDDVNLSDFDWLFQYMNGAPVWNENGDPWDEDADGWDNDHIWKATGETPISDAFLYPGTYFIACVKFNPNDPDDILVGYGIEFTIAQPLKLPINHRLSTKDNNSGGIGGK
jgi:hypothetical protein